MLSINHQNHQTLVRIHDSYIPMEDMFEEPNYDLRLKFYISVDNKKNVSTKRLGYTITYRTLRRRRKKFSTMRIKAEVKERGFGALPYPDRLGRFPR